MDTLATSAFWIAVGQIIMIDILLGGDNAVVIALACRSLPAQQRTKGIVWGTVGAIVLRVILIFFALALLQIPFLKLVGAALLVWIGVKLLLPESEGGGGHADVVASDKLWGAVKTVIVADLVMSVDNVIAIAGAAENAGGDHTMPLVVFGLLVSIPIIVFGSQMVLKLMDRFPIVITLGGMLLGWIAGTMAVTDPAVAGWMPHDGAARQEVSAVVRYAAGVVGALLVLGLGRWLAVQRRAAAAVPVPVPVPGVPALARIRRVLLAVDGSEGSSAAARRVLALRDELRAGPELELHIVNVQRPLSDDVARFVAGKTIDEHHRENSEKALAVARAVLGPAAASAREHALVGEPGPSIAALARDLGGDLIVAGARGLSPAAATLLGSVAQSIVEHSPVPVLVVR